jgi:hypothetical protein
MDARLHPKLLQALCRAVHKVAEIAIGNPLAHEVDRRTIRPFGHGIIQNALHRSGYDLGIPEDAPGIGVDPGLVVHEFSFPPWQSVFRLCKLSVARQRLAGSKDAAVGG